jgi:hypothetical protein
VFKYGFVNGRIAGFYTALHRYLVIVRWLTKDSLWRFWQQSAFILLSSFLGVTFQASVIAFVLLYARILERGENLPLLGLQIEPRSSVFLLVLVSSAMLVALLCSAGLIYFAGVSTIKLARQYEQHCAERVIHLLSSSFKIWTPLDIPFSSNSLVLKYARSDARTCARVLRILLQSIVPAFRFIIAAVALAYINILLSLFLLIFFGMFSLFLYKLNIVGARKSEQMEKYNAGMSREYRSIITRLKVGNLSLPLDDRWLDRNLFNTGETNLHLEGYQERFLVIEKSNLANNILLAIAIFTILLVLGISIFQEGQNWGRLAIYLIALRETLNSLKTISAKLTSINRFYLQIRRYFQFIENTGAPSQAIPQPTHYTLAPGHDQVGDSLVRWRLAAGQRVGLLSPVELSRYTLTLLLDNLLGHSKKAVNSALSSPWFVTSGANYLPQLSLRENLGLSAGYIWQDLRQELQQAGLAERLEAQLPPDLETRLTPEAWEQVDREVRFALALLPALSADCHWVLLEEKGLSFLKPPAREYFLKRLANKITVIVFHKNLATAGMYGEDAIAVIDGKELIGLGPVDWFGAHQDQIAAIVSQAAGQFVKQAVAGEDDEEDDDAADEI